MAFRDRYRDDDTDRDGGWRSDQNRGQFSYEGEGYSSGGSRDAERDLQQNESDRNRDRNDFDRDREYGGRSDAGRDEWRGSAGRGDHRGGYGRDTSRGDYTTSFTGGGYGTGDRYGSGGYDRGGYGSGSTGRGYGSGYGSGYSGSDAYDRSQGSDAGYRGSGFMGGDFSSGAPNNPTGGASFGLDVPRRTYRTDYENSSWRDDRGSDFRDYRNGSMGRGGYGESLAQQERPSYRGRGPRGYQRSDERIREEVCERLAMDHDVDATDLDISVTGGIVTLSGRVSDRQQKRRAENVAEDIGGVKDVQNNIRVERGDHENGSIFGNRPGAAAAAATAAASNSGTAEPTGDLSSNAAGTTVTGTPTTTSNKSRAK